MKLAEQIKTLLQDENFRELYLISLRRKEWRRHYMFDESLLLNEDLCIFKRELGDRVSVDQSFPGLLYFMKKRRLRYEIEDGKMFMNVHDAWSLSRVICTSISQSDYISLAIDFEPEEWIQFLEKHSLIIKTEGYTLEEENRERPYLGISQTGSFVLSEELPKQFYLELSTKMGVPICCSCGIRFHPTEPIITIAGRYVVLLQAFETVLDYVPYDIEEQKTLVHLICDAYDYSLNSLERKYLKIDYEFVVLKNYKEFKRIQENAQIDFQRESLPRYWFEDLQMECLNAEERTFMDLLAIEKSWADDPHSKTRYLIRCGFPAGAMFLKTTVEAQTTTQGGGVEYIYIQRPEIKHHIFFVESTKIEIE